MNPKVCNIYLTTAEGQKLVATVSLVGTEITTKALSGRINVGSILDDTHLVNGKRTSIKDDPVGWFNALPSHYSGGYMRAAIVA